MDFFLTQGDDSLYMPPVFKIIIKNYFHKRIQLFMVCGTPDPKNYIKLYNNVGVSFINKKAPMRRLFEPEAFHLPLIAIFFEPVLSAFMSQSGCFFVV